MLKLTIAEILKRIDRGVPFEAQVRDGSFRIKIARWVPYVCTAIHDGHHLRSELKSKIAVSDYERWYEEDPYTGDFISSLPIVMVGQDSRYEYDLNRKPEEAIFSEAWGKKVWHTLLTKEERERSLKKHHNYYKVAVALVQKIESMFGGCVVYDLHSYNYRRWNREVPVFNIGTERIDNNCYGDMAEAWKKELEQIHLPNNIQTSVGINDTFFGRGYNLAIITANCPNTLVLATEVKKIYCDERNGSSFPVVIQQLKRELKKAILNHAYLFATTFTNWNNPIKEQLLSASLEKAILKVDKELYHLVKDFELLNYVNPVNVEKEKKKFFKSRCTLNPEFQYRPLNIDAFELKRKLHRLEIDRISDVSIQELYIGAVNGFIDKIDLLSSLGTDKFLYNSLRYFGEPNASDLTNAQYLIHLPEIEEQSAEKTLDVEDARAMFTDAFEDYGFSGKIEVSKNLVAHAMVLNQQKKVLLKKGATFSPKGLRFLMHHEIGVHMVTTMNSNLQPLKIFNVGLPVNTKTQEGLAVLAEYLSGNITIKRLKELGLRVLAAHSLASGADFKTTFRMLVNELNMDVNEAFYMTTRIYRGGGLTKDYLYLRGFRELHHLWKSGTDLSPLLIGKTSSEYYDTIVEMINRGMLREPKYITKVISHPETDRNNPIFDYVIKGIR